MISQLFRYNTKIPEICLIADSGLGLIPALITILTQCNKKNPNEFDFNQLLVNMRQMMLQLELYSQKSSDESILLKNLKLSEELLISKIKYQNLPSNFVERVFEELRCKKIIEDYALPKTKKDGFLITINKEFNQSKNVIFTKNLFDKLNLPNNICTEIKVLKNKPIHDPNLTVEKFDLTTKIKKELESINIDKFILERFPQLEELKQYKYNFLLPLVSTIHNFPEQTAVYFMLHYNVSKKISLEIADAELNKHIPLLLSKNKKLITILKECRQACKTNTSGHGFLKKLLVRFPDSDQICVIFFLTFLSDVVNSKQKNLPLKKLYDYLKPNFNAENIYMYGVKKFSFLEGKV